MKRIIAASLTGLVLMANILHAADEPTTRPIVASGNAFALDLYAQLESQKGNLCISPFSISSALDMTTAGARGQTAAQMLAMLHWTEKPDALHDAVADLKLRGETQRDGSQLNIANSLFGQVGFNYHPDFLKLLSDKYFAELQQVDFHDPAQAAAHVNRWAAAQTHDRIKEALPASAIDESTRLVLINAIYFKASWARTFEESATEDQPFFLAEGQPVNAPLMRQQHSFSYYENSDLQLASLPYRGRFEMDVLLPRARAGLPALEKSLTTDSLNTWLNGLRPQLLDLFLPKFENNGGFGLKDPLKALGMSDAFDPKKADFTGMSSDPLYVGAVIHKTFISVNEAGTEAAASTAVVMNLTAAAPLRNPQQPVVFRADHPFLYLIRDRVTGAILFIGRVASPNDK